MSHVAEKSPSVVEYDSDSSTEWSGALYGVRRYLGMIGLSLALFLTGIDATIVSTSLVTIVNDLENSEQSSWIITSYLLTYTGFIVIWSNLGDVFGVKQALLSSLFLFTAFSGGCGGAQTFNQLVISRAFQGIGGAGVYTLACFSFIRIVPPEQYKLTTTIAGGVISLGLVLGPLFGGAISNSGKWRWVFLYNLPAGAFAWLVIFLVLPSHFPHKSPPPTSDSKSNRIWENTKSCFRQLDLMGAFIILTACSLIIAALQEGNSQYAWDSALVISFLVISGVFWFAFVGWEWFISQHYQTISPVFPWRLTHNRTYMGLALGFFTTGLPLTVCVIMIPQRFQTVNGSSPIGAGVKLLSFALSCQVGIIACSLLSGRAKVPFCYIALFGIACQIAGLFPFSEIASTPDLWLGQFGYLVLAGLGTGLSVSAFYMATSLVVDPKDQNIALSIGIQLRSLGGVAGVAAVTTILHHYIQSRLSSSLQPQELAALMQTTTAINNFPSDVQLHVREVYAMAYSAQMKLTGAFSVTQLLAVALMWKKENV